MKAVFADTSFYQALLNPRDNGHRVAVALSETFRGQVVTSEYVLCELGALMSHAHLRQIFLDLVTGLKSAPQVEIVPSSHDLFEAGLDLFSVRPDKKWSLTDCISFAIMRAQDIEEALTCDRHFEQANFRALMLQKRAP